MSSTKNIVKVKEIDKVSRLDVFLSKQLNFSRSKAQKLIKDGKILINDKTIKKAGYQVEAGDIIESESSESEPAKRESLKDWKIEVLRQNKDYLVINKPAGLLVHPTKEEKNTLVDWLLKNYPEIKSVGEYKNRPGIVHRLDKSASGLLVVAKTPAMFAHLKKQFQNREIEKEYCVLVHGEVKADHDIIDFDIDRGKEGKMVSRPKVDRLKLKSIKHAQPGREAVTEFWAEKRLINYTLLRVRIYTGRTHQIRVHLLAYNHPVVGDSLYFNKRFRRKNNKSWGRLFLHASRLCFRDLQGERVCFESALPKELEDFLAKLK